MQAGKQALIEQLSTLLLAIGLHIGGWCPKDRLAEDGVNPDDVSVAGNALPAVFPTNTMERPRRGWYTLILTRNDPKGGTALTIDTARRLHKPYRVIDLTTKSSPLMTYRLVDFPCGYYRPERGRTPGKYSARVFIMKAYDWLQEVLGKSQA